MKDMRDTPTAVQQRAEAPRLHDFSLTALHEQLPLPFPSEDAPEVPDPFRARSWYTYPGWARLTDPEALADLEPFTLALHLMDFSPLRGELVRLTGIHVNARGETPFDPVSLFLGCLLRWATGRGWESLAKLLAGPHGDGWRRLLGLRAGDTPAASTLRGFFRALDTSFERDLCPRFIELLAAAGLLPPHDPESDTPARDGIPLAVDGMLHDAHENTSCHHIRETCYQPTSPAQPRPCPAQEAGHRGCACATEDCTATCQRATPRDREARFIHYTGRNRAGAEDPSRERNVHGYRSYAHILVDDELHTYWVAHTSVHPANTAERVIFPQDFTHVRTRLSELPCSELVADAAVGYTPCLETIYAAGVIPIVDIRQHSTDEDPDACLWRGYDEHGRPLCPHGYPRAFNGLDYQRLRATWVCHQGCRRAAEAAPEEVACPFRDAERPLGLVRHVKNRNSAKVTLLS